MTLKCAAHSAFINQQDRDSLRSDEKRNKAKLIETLAGKSFGKITKLVLEIR